jgi:uncharacterized protein (DUF58 family)
MAQIASPTTPVKADDTSAEALLRRLEWTVLKRLDGLLQGDFRTLRRGNGVDLADLREYQLHDDVRHIDWNVTARLDVPHVRQFTEDRDLTAWFLLDLSGSVDFGSGDTTKLAVSAGFVTAVSRLLTRHGNRVGAMLYGSQVDAVLPPGSSRTHVLNLLQRMRTPRPRPPQARGATRRRWPWWRSPDQAVGGQTATALADLLHAAAPMLRRRSMVFVVSDFISTPGWEAPLARLAQRHEVIAVRLFDPLENALPEMGLVTLEDAETGEQLFVDSADPAFRQRYESIALAREAKLREALAGSGADTLELATDDDLLQSLLRWCDLRRQRARLKTSHHFPAAFQRATASKEGRP